MQLKNKVLLGILMMICSWSASAQCPEITIDQKYDHIPTGLCAENGWDTVVNCRNRTLILNATPFITTQHFNGTYLFQGSDAYWDGTDMQGRKCPQGAYVYVIRYRTALEPNITQTLKGSITLIR